MKVIVLTPVKNEDWILDVFLQVTSSFADHIILADQQSTDRSRAICANYPKAIVIENPSGQFNEHERQLLLINTAREMFGTHHLLLALDADEILAANTLLSTEWNTIKSLAKGTTICVEKPDLFKSIHHCFRYPSTYPLGFVDDGREHTPATIHSIRVPVNPHQMYQCTEIKFIHFGLANFDRQLAKVRYYSVVENLLERKNFLQRYEGYSPRLQEPNFLAKNELHRSEPVWFEGWERQGISFKIDFTEDANWYNREIVKVLDKWGCKRFWLDDIWEVNWIDEARRNSVVLVDSPSPVIVREAVKMLYVCKKMLTSLLKKMKIR